MAGPFVGRKTASGYCLVTYLATLHYVARLLAGWT